MPRLFSALARSGRKAGLAAASSRQSRTASSVGARASCAAPHLAVADAEVVQRHGEVGQEGGVGGGQLPVELDGFLGGGQGVVRAGPPRCSGCRGCSARRRGRAGRRGWSRPAPGTAGRLPRPGRPPPAGNPSSRGGPATSWSAKATSGSSPDSPAARPRISVQPGRARGGGVPPDVPPQVAGTGDRHAAGQQLRVPAQQRRGDRLSLRIEHLLVAWRRRAGGCGRPGSGARSGTPPRRPRRPG